MINIGVFRDFIEVFSFYFLYKIQMWCAGLVLSLDHQINYLILTT